MLFICFFLGLILAPAHGKEIVFEKFEQLSGFDIYRSTLRIRKFNSTTTVLNGTFTVRTMINNSIVVSTEFYHSSRGNQQFNHYPMKLPTHRFCDFKDQLYDDYPHATDNMINLPQKGECPIVPRDVHILNKIFPDKTIPPVFPTGLWKIFIINSLEDVEVARFEFLLKITSELFL